MLHTKCQAPEPSSSEEDFKYIPFLNTRPIAAGPLCTIGPPYEQSLVRFTRHSYILNFKHLSQAVLKKKIFEYFSM